MTSFRLLIVSLVLINVSIFNCKGRINHNNHEIKTETVMIAILVRNKEHTLPYFLTCLERLDYPKDRISLWISSDNNVDNSTELLRAWLEKNGPQYHGYKAVLVEDSRGFASEKSIADWPFERQQHVIKLREDALRAAKAQWADFLWMLDADVFITEPTTLSDLISYSHIVSAPMLKSHGYYSNFWGGMSSGYYYERTEEYLEILDSKKKGCFPVPMIHSAVLIDLRTVLSDSLTYDPSKLSSYKGPFDDIITFASSASIAEIPLMICNEKVYGYIMPNLESGDGIDLDIEQLHNIKMESLCYENELNTTEDLAVWVKTHITSALEEVIHRVYVINLVRRPERRERMIKSLKELNITATFFEAVDLMNVPDENLNYIHFMPTYEDPYHKRPMKKGELGCFLSHYLIWEEIIREKPDKPVLVLEDDVRFEPFFRRKLDVLLNEAARPSIHWDFIYLGRKKMHEDNEDKVGGLGIMVMAGYSYWTIGYLINYQGASKLVSANPLEKVVPVDEYVPILSDKHPRNDWKKYFKKRDLVVLSSEPLLLYPLVYAHSENYVSDTENSPLVSFLNSKDEL